LLCVVGRYVDLGITTKNAKSSGAISPSLYKYAEKDEGL
jgi:hypothetical protein